MEPLAELGREVCFAGRVLPIHLRTSAAILTRSLLSIRCHTALPTARFACCTLARAEICCALSPSAAILCGGGVAWYEDLTVCASSSAAAAAVCGGQDGCTAGPPLTGAGVGCQASGSSSLFPSPPGLVVCSGLGFAKLLADLDVGFFDLSRAQGKSGFGVGMRCFAGDIEGGVLGGVGTSTADARSNRYSGSSGLTGSPMNMRMPGTCCISRRCSIGHT